MVKEELDVEWMELVKEALSVGITKTEIKEFLQSQTNPTNRQVIKTS
ncbi:anti-repressor SinI family protein [Bacillus coahuilensis]|nr:anti-repressor SinI family protein [Bacillus coahuilensis]